MFSYLRKNPLIRWSAVKHWCKQILHGLKYLHENQVIHRDIKCDNIFINGTTGDIRIGDIRFSFSLFTFILFHRYKWIYKGDLGLSTKISEADTKGTPAEGRQITTQTMTCLGTPEFMAPELYEENYDKLVDIYAFGMVFCAFTYYFVFLLNKFLL